MARSKNRLFSKFIRQINDDLTIQTTALVEEARVTTNTVSTQVDSAVAALVEAAPAALDTLDELAAALGDDANFATTVTNSLATKANISDIIDSAGISSIVEGYGYTTYDSSNTTGMIGNLATETYVDGAVASAGGGTTVYDSAGLLPVSGHNAGDMGYTTAESRLYISNGTGWYSIGLINATPRITSGSEATYDLSTNGSDTVITLEAADSDGTPIAWSYEVTSGSLSPTATITQEDNVFTLTPADSMGANGIFEITFKASDGISFDTSVSQFTLAISAAYKFSGSNWANNTINIFGIDGEISSGYGGGTATSSTVLDTCYIVQPTGHTGYSYLYVPAPYDVGYTIYRGYGTDANSYANKKYTWLGVTTHNRDFCVSPTNNHILTDYGGSFNLYNNASGSWNSYSYGSPSRITQQTQVGSMSTSTSTYGGQPYWAQNNCIYSTKNGTPGTMYCHLLGGTVSSPSASISHQWTITLPTGVNSPGRPFISNDGTYCIVGCMSTGKVVTLLGQAAFDFRNYTVVDEITITETTQGRNRFGGIFGSYDGLYFITASFNYNNQGSNPSTNGYLHRWVMP